MSLLALLPALVFGLLLATFRAAKDAQQRPVREDGLRAVLVFGVIVVAGAEFLSLPHALTRRGAFVFWCLASAVAAVALLRRVRSGGWPSLRWSLPPGRFDRALAAGIAAAMLVLLLVALLAPPQSSDSIGYHMSRVVHWIQNGTLAHYPAHDERQLFQPPMAEILRLHLMLLTGGDRVGQLAQWLAALGSLAAVSLLAADLGAGRRGQLLAALFSVTLPIGISQASSGKNDWVAALWLLAFVHFLIAGTGLSRARPARRDDLLAAGVAMGLAFLTKLTNWFFVLPISFAVIARTPRASLRRLVPLGATALLLAVALNVPHGMRNANLYGNPFSSPVNSREMGLAKVTPATVLSVALRNAALELGTPSRDLNSVIQSATVALHGLLGVDPNDRQTSAEQFEMPPLHRVEERASNPLHLMALLACGVALAASRRLRADRARLAFLAAIGASYLIFCSVVKFQGPNLRLLLPLFMLSAALVGTVLGDVRVRWVAPLVAGCLVVTSLPWLLATEARPLSFGPGVGLFASARSDLYLARFSTLRGPYARLARLVRQTGVRRLGLVFAKRGHAVQALEYPLWVMLDDGGAPVRIEHVNVQGPSGVLARSPSFREFQPELIAFMFYDRPQERPAQSLEAAGGRYALAGIDGTVAVYALEKGGDVVWFRSLVIGDRTPGDPWQAATAQRTRAWLTARFESPRTLATATPGSPGSAQAR